MMTITEILFILFGGVALSGITLAYRYGQARGIPVMHIAFFVLLGAGSFFFVQTDWSVLARCPVAIIAIGLACGVSQYVLMRLMALALGRGPLSPVNCAVFLSFVLVIVYSRLAFGETLYPMQLAGVATAVLCVASGALQASGGGKTGQRPEGGTRLVYCALLLALFFLSGVTYVSFKHLSMTPAAEGGSLMSLYRMQVLSLLYLSLLLCLGAQLVREAPSLRALLRALGPGALGAVCSGTGLSISSTYAYLPAAFMFPVSAITSILFGALAAAIFFGEPRTPAWWVMIGSGSVTATLLITDALMRLT